LKCLFLNKAYASKEILINAVKAVRCMRLSSFKVTLFEEIIE